jgi:hypothetical protein
MSVIHLSPEIKLDKLLLPFTEWITFYISNQNIIKIALRRMNRALFLLLRAQVCTQKLPWNNVIFKRMSVKYFDTINLSLS